MSHFIGVSNKLIYMPVLVLKTWACVSPNCWITAGTISSTAAWNSTLGAAVASAHYQGICCHSGEDKRAFVPLKPFLTQEEKGFPLTGTQRNCGDLRLGSDIRLTLYCYGWNSLSMPRKLQMALQKCTFLSFCTKRRVLGHRSWLLHHKLTWSCIFNKCFSRVTMSFAQQLTASQT